MYDSHCHLSPRVTEVRFQELLPLLKNTNVSLNIMSTNHIDSKLLLKITTINDKVYANFGIHPWFSHLYTLMPIPENPEDTSTFKRLHYESVLKPYSKSNQKKIIPDKLIDALPLPMSLQDALIEFDNLFSQNPITLGVGEIGIDKSFRIPNSGYLGNPLQLENTGLSHYKVCMDHQVSVLREQLKLATKWRLRISLHCVNAHGVLYEELKCLGENIRISMHSYSGSIDHAKVLIRRLNVWFGISFVINLINDQGVKRIKDLIDVDAKILIETDLGLDGLMLNEYKEFFNGSHEDMLNNIASILEGLGISKQKLFDNWNQYLNIKP